MNCPEHLILSWPRLRIWHIQYADVRREYVTWAEVLNPLRYDISLGRPGNTWHWNHDAWMWRAVRNALFKVRALCWLRGHDWYELNGFASHSAPTLRCEKCGKLRKADYND